MSHPHTPVTFSATYEVAPEHRADLEGIAADYVERVRTHEPETFALGLYFDEAQGTFTHVQMLSGPEAMDAHLRNVQEFIRRAYAFVAPRRIDVFGPAGPVLVRALEDNAAAGAQITVHSGGGLGGFGRSK